MMRSSLPITQRDLVAATLRARLALLRWTPPLFALFAGFAPLERSLATWLGAKLKRMQFVFKALVTLRAASHLARPRPSPAGPPAAPRPAWKRALFGARLRRALRGKGPQGRLAALIRFAEAAERLIARQARRLRNGLTRRRGGHKREARPARLALALIGFARTGLDTS